MDPDNIPFGCEDDVITTQIDAREYLPCKLAAMRAYPTQIDMKSGFFSFAEVTRASPAGSALRGCEVGFAACYWVEVWAEWVIF